MDYTLLVMLLKDLVILPFQEIKLELKDEISKKIIKLSNKKYGERVLIVSPIDSDNETSVDDLPKVGVIAYIKSNIELNNGNIRLTLRGEKRVKILEYRSFTEDIIDAQITDVILPKFEPTGEEVIKRKLKTSLEEYVASNSSVSNSILKIVNENEDLGFLTDAITSFLPLDTLKKHDYMLELNSEKRAISLIQDINIEIKYNELDEKLSNNVEIRLTKEQEEYYLREKLKEIENALDIKEDELEDANKYLNILNDLKLPVKTHEKLLNEIAKLKRIPKTSPEYGVIVNYLEWVLFLPWHYSSNENINVKNVLSHLNKSHYGLSLVKERIEDYVNVKNINHDIANPVICLVGPPGIGKTTLSNAQLLCKQCNIKKNVN